MTNDEFKSSLQKIKKITGNDRFALITDCGMKYTNNLETSFITPDYNSGLLDIFYYENGLAPDGGKMVAVLNIESVEVVLADAEEKVNTRKALEEIHKVSKDKVDSLIRKFF